MATKEITTSNFNSQLAGVLKSDKNIRESVQALIEFGLEMYASEHENLDYLSTLLQKTEEMKSVKTSAIQQYIMASANVRTKKDKEGNIRFKKDGEQAEVSMPDVPWYKYKKEPANGGNFDLDKRLNSLKDQIIKAQSEGKEIKAEEWQRELNELQETIDAIMLKEISRESIEHNAVEEQKYIPA